MVKLVEWWIRPALCLNVTEPPLKGWAATACEPISFIQAMGFERLDLNIIMKNKIPLALKIKWGWVRKSQPSLGQSTVLLPTSSSRDWFVFLNILARTCDGSPKQKHVYFGEPANCSEFSTKNCHYAERKKLFGSLLCSVNMKHYDCVVAACTLVCTNDTNASYSWSWMYQYAFYLECLNNSILFHISVNMADAQPCQEKKIILLWGLCVCIR